MACAIRLPWRCYVAHGVRAIRCAFFLFLRRVSDVMGVMTAAKG